MIRERMHNYMTLGLSEADRKTIEPERYESNAQTLREVSKMGILFFAVGSVIPYIYEGNLVKTGMMLLFALMFLGVLTILTIGKKRHIKRKLVVDGAELFCTELILFAGTYMSVITNPKRQAVIFMVFMVCIQLLFVWEPITMLIATLLGSAFFVVMLFCYKEFDLIRYDLVNGLITMILSFHFGTLVTRNKVQQLLLKKQLKDRGDEIYYKSLKEYQSITLQALTTMARTIDAKDTYTNGHSLRVAGYAREIGRRYGMKPEEQERIYYIGLLHDIGKIGIPDAILNKPGSLTREEFEVIKTHPAIGGEILKDFTAIEGIADGARLHHERIDGQGYNAKLAGEEIPIMVRIISVADTYDAISSDRSYRKALPKNKIIEVLEEAAGTQLDAALVAIAVRMVQENYKVVV